MNHVTFPQFLTTPVGLLRLSHAELKALEVGLQRRVETVLDVLVQVRLVVLDREEVTPTTGDDLGGDLPLASHRVDRHQRTGKVEQLQQSWDRRDLIRLLIDR